MLVKVSLVGLLGFQPTLAADSKILLSEPAARVAGENVYRWGDTIQLRFDFAGKAEDFQARCSLEGCRMWVPAPDPLQDHTTFTIPLLYSPDDRGQSDIRFAEQEGDGLLRGEALIRAIVKDENGETKEYVDVARAVFWVEHPARPAPGTLQVLGGQDHLQGDRITLDVTPRTGEWKVGPATSHAGDRVLLVRPALTLPSGLRTTERLIAAVDIPADPPRVEMILEDRRRSSQPSDLPIGTYELRLQRDGFVIDRVPIHVRPRLPSVTFRETAATDTAPNSVIVSVTDFPDLDLEPAIGILTNHGERYYPMGVYPDGFFQGEWNGEDHWNVTLVGDQGTSVTAYAAFPHDKDSHNVIGQFASRGHSVELGTHEIQGTRVPLPGQAPLLWTDLHDHPVFRPGEPLTLGFHITDSFGRTHAIPTEPPFSVILRANQSWDAALGEPPAGLGAEVTRIGISAEDPRLALTLPEADGDFRLDIEQDGELVDSIPISVLAPDPAGFSVLVNQGNDVTAEHETKAVVTMPLRRLTAAVYLQIERPSGRTRSGLQLGPKHIFSEWLWVPPTAPRRFQPNTPMPDLPEARTELDLDKLTVPGDYEARLAMIATDRNGSPTRDLTVVRQRFRVVAPQASIREMEYDENQRTLAVVVDVPPGFDYPAGSLRVGLATSHRRTLNGAVVPSRAAYEMRPEKATSIESDDTTLRFLLRPPVHRGSFEAMVLYLPGGFLGERPEVILDRKWFRIPGSDRAPPTAFYDQDPWRRGPEDPVHPFPDHAPGDGRTTARRVDGQVDPPPLAETEAFVAPPTLSLSMGRTPEGAQAGGPMHVGLRVTNRGPGAVAGVSLSVQLFDDGSGLPLENWTSATEHVIAEGDGSFVGSVDSLAANEAFDLVLTGDAREAQRILWVAHWTSEGDAVGRQEASGRITASHAPAIFDVLPLDDQRQYENGVYSAPYPFVPDDDNLISTVQRRPTTRRLFVVGRNLPQKVGDERVLRSDDPRVSYRILSLPNDDNQFWRESYENAWKRYRGGRRTTGSPTRLEGLLILAEFQEGALPGEKALRLNDAEGRWDLRFGDLTGTISFVRDTGPRQVEVIDHSYLPESVRIAVTTNRELPMTEVPVDLLTSGEGFTTRNTYSLVARRTSHLGPNVYLSPPIRLIDHRQASLSPPPSGEAGELSLAVNGAELPLALAFARVGDDFAKRSLAMPMNPSQAELRLARTPANDVINHLWKSALMRVAKVHEIKHLDWDDVDGVVVDEIWNLIVVTRDKHVLNQDVTLGHHAAMILLRDVFQVMTRTEIENLGRIRQDDRAARGFMEYMSTFWLNQDFPVNRVEVTDPNGKAITYDMVSSADNKIAAKEYSTAGRTFTAAEIDAWRIRATKEALGKLQEAAKASIQMAADTEDDEIEDLLKLTGFSFDAVREHLLTRLMRLQESTDRQTNRRHLSWATDDAARYWVRGVAPLAEAVKKQQAKSRTDSDILLAAAAMLTLPLALSESAAVAFIAFSIDALDLAVTAGTEIPQYLESRWEQEFSEGAAITLGYERNKAAIAEAKGWASTTFAVGTSAFGAVGGVFDVVDAASKIRLARKISRGRDLAQQVDTVRLGALSQRELDDFLVFSIDAKARALARGSDALDSAQRRALDAIETAAAERKAASAARPSADTAAGVDVARLDVDPTTGTAKITPEPRIKLRKPVARATPIRGPPDAPPSNAPALRIDSSSPDFDEKLLEAPAGTPVTDPRPFGMLDDALRHFQETVNTFQLRVRVRGANPSSMQLLRQGHPPKHVKLKSKTINDLDVRLGARPGSEGMVGYFLPTKPPDFDALSKLPDTPKIVNRYRQRLKEYYDNFKDIERLKEQGLVSVEEGVVIDRGLASTRLDIRSGKLVPIRGPPDGTGRGFTGDYDMWDITHPDGSRILTNPDHPRFDADAVRRKEALLQELGDGTANTQHGPHKDWEPTTERDLEIDQRIRDSHRGERLPDGTIGPLSRSEGLLEFQPNAQPRVSYEYEAPPRIQRGSDPGDPATAVTFTDVDGLRKNLPLGERLGRPGSTSVAYEHADFPDTQVVRVTAEKPGHPAVLLDDYGRRVLEKEISSPHIRAAKELDRWDIPDQAGGFSRVSVVERVTPIQQALEGTGGVMTHAQQQVFVAALQDLNRQGYVWLDNKWDNFGFAENADGTLSVVVLDTGGIFKVSGSGDAAGDLARQMQLYVNGPLADFSPRGTVLPVAARAALRKAELADTLLHEIDLGAMGLSELSQLKFNAISGEQFDYVGPSFAR